MPKQKTYNRRRRAKLFYFKGFTPIKCLPLAIGGIRCLYRFKNGYGASVARGPFTYGGRDGLWELAILRGANIDYTTPITRDVIGYLNEEEVQDVLRQINNLPKPRGN